MQGSNGEKPNFANTPNAPGMCVQRECVICARNQVGLFVGLFVVANTPNAPGMCVRTYMCAHCDILIFFLILCLHTHEHTHTHTHTHTQVVVTGEFLKDIINNK